MPQQHQPTVLMTTQQSHPWTISGFNGLNGNVVLTFKCDAPVASHGLLCSRDHIYAAAIDRPSIYVWNLNSRVCSITPRPTLIVHSRIEITRR